MDRFFKEGKVNYIIKQGAMGFNQSAEK